MDKSGQIIIGLAGEPGSGKDTVAKHLKDRYGAKEIRFSDPLFDALRNFVDAISREDLQWLSHAVRERFGQDIFAKALVKRMSANDGVVIFNGIRFWENYDFVKSFPQSFIIYVTADQKLRWERSTNRMEKSDDNSSFAKFQELEKFETEAIIPEIGAKADFMIKNEQTLEYLLEESDKIMEKIRQ
ncbi:MAG: AAA family ATPase [Candidatus Moranbacteria bacterium]|nr:AAA family ATPase [bacterium]MDP1834249.1 AAA family ATPase [Candidatus Moranbacteria bacterium]